MVPLLAVSSVFLSEEQTPGREKDACFSVFRGRRREIARNGA